MKTKSLHRLLFLSVILLTGLGCTTEEIIFDADVQLQSDQMAVDQFLARHEISANRDPSGFSYVIDEVGDGAFAPLDGIIDLEMTVYQLDSTFVFSTIPEVEIEQGVDVLFHEVYTVYLETDPIFRRPFPVSIHALAGLIKKGGSIRLFVPSALGWGTEGLSWGLGDISNRREVQIPANTNILITATLVDVR